MRYRDTDFACSGYSRSSNISRFSRTSTGKTEIGRDLFNIFPWHGIEREYPYAVIVFKEGRKILSSLSREQQIVVSSYIDMVREYTMKRLPGFIDKDHLPRNIITGIMKNELNKRTLLG
ncbi:hypothetical protein A3Q56_04246 [Intoshia linei]|uniref:Uncharacterized protein n=1 Tax=Intoshia linei TaxID=1819745 RepID=A0A177B165_9BILA|nr:hypothetical protein A3Q56_04246 [Intoshia linei]